MPHFPIPQKAYTTKLGTYTLPRKYAEKVTGGILGLGEKDEESSIDCIAAVFDLKGFTRFCSQPEPQRYVPEFTRRFVHWFFEALTKYSTSNEETDTLDLYHPFPIFTKFLGDGMLLLWDVKGWNDYDVALLLGTARQLLRSYEADFLPKVAGGFEKPPQKLKCGVARGIAVRIGDDYVGSCINLASRIQNLPGETFAASRLIFHPTGKLEEHVKDKFIEKRVAVKGRGTIPVIILKKKFL